MSSELKNQEQSLKSLSRKQSEIHFVEAQACFPGGVNSPVRAFRSVGGTPVFVKRAKGAYIWDEDGNRYLDFVGSWGTAILGHAHDEVLDFVKYRMDNGLSFGAPTKEETELAVKVRQFFPALEMMRFVSSGTEACMASIRLARGFTGRSKIIKFEGNYHGHGDMLLVKAGSGVATFGLPDSAGVTAGVAQSTLTAPYNDIQAVQDLFAANPGDIAAVILEPIVGNAGFIRPQKSFLSDLRDLCSREGALLIFDEVMTGFRTHLGGVQALYNIKPDLVTLGKVVGGGMPLAVYGGRSDIMKMVAPLGSVYQAGTLSGNPVAVACGLKTLEILGRPGNFAQISLRTGELVTGMKDIAAKHHVAFQADHEGGMFGFFFAKDPVFNFSDAKKCNVDLFKSAFHSLLDGGHYFAPSAFEAGFVSLAHKPEDIKNAIACFDRTLDALK